MLFRSVETVEPVQPPIETAQLPAETIPEEDPLFDLDALGIPRHFLLTEQEIEDAVPKAGANARDTGTPETSDNHNGFWVLLHILSLLGLTVLCLRKHRKGKEREK